MVVLNLETIHQGQTRVTKQKSSYNYKSSYIIGLKGLGCEIKPQEIMSWKSFDVEESDLGLLLQGQTRVANLKFLNLHIIGSRGKGCEIFWKTWPGNLFTVRFDLCYPLSR